MTTHNPIRLGIIGYGRATRVHHLPALRRLPQFEVAALADIDPEARIEGFRFFTDPREMIAQVDAVAVATPTTTHLPLAIAALEAGRPLFLEKPAAMSAAECDRIAEAQARAGQPVLVAHNSRWHGLVREAKTLIEQGRLGKIVAVRSTYTHAHSKPEDHWHRRRAEGGGVLVNDAIHHFDLWRFLTGMEIEILHTAAVDSDRFEDDTAAVVARFSNDALATAILTFDSTNQSEIEIHGDRATLLLNLYRFDGLHILERAEFPGALKTRVREAWNFFRRLPARSCFDASYQAMWAHFADCVHGRSVPLCTLQDARAVVVDRRRLP